MVLENGNSYTTLGKDFKTLNYKMKEIVVI